MSWNSPRRPPPPPPGRPAAPAPGASPAARWGVTAWGHALVAVVAAFAAMALTAWLGLWLLGAGDLGGGTMPSLVAATVALGVGGRVELSGAEQTGEDSLFGELTGDLELARGTGEVDIMLLGVGLVGALVLGWLFLRPLRHRLVVGGGELAAHAGRVAVFGALALGAVAGLGRHDLPIGDLVPQPGEDAPELLGIFDLGAAARFETDAASTMGYGLLWLALAVVVSVAVSTHRPVPRWWQRHRDELRAPVAGVLAVLLGAVVLGVLGTPFVAAEAPSPRRMIGGMVLALPTAMFLLVTLGLGIEWKAGGNGEFTFGLPGPLGQLLGESGEADRPITVARLAELDGRAWWVCVMSGVLLVLGATLMALRAPARVRLWEHALRFAVALALGLVVAAFLAQVHLKVAVEVLFGAIEPGGGIELHPDYLMTILLGLLWGACAGLLGGALAAWIRSAREPAAGLGPAGVAPGRVPPSGAGPAGPPRWSPPPPAAPGTPPGPPPGPPPGAPPAGPPGPPSGPPSGPPGAPGPG